MNKWKEIKRRINQQRNDITSKKGTKNPPKTSKHPEDVNAPKRLQGKRICPFYSSYSKTVPHKTIQIQKKKTNKPPTWKKNYDEMKSFLSFCRLKTSRILQRHLLTFLKHIHMLQILYGCFELRSFLRFVVFLFLAVYFKYRLEKEKKIFLFFSSRFLCPPLYCHPYLNDSRLLLSRS